MKTPVTESEAVTLMEQLDVGGVLQFTFGPGHLALVGDTEDLEAIRDEAELQAVRDFAFK